MKVLKEINMEFPSGLTLSDLTFLCESIGGAVGGKCENVDCGSCPFHSLELYHLFCKEVND